ncbi:MAG TPA: NADH-quinone oxidoreductase subunit M, partial [Acidimicrobiales bacterium]|nr:NADH-quinone oxidoreductase subunit M [Acidimicrobiales bacterium]
MNNNEFLTDWGLTLMVFLPLAGALVMLLIPKAEEQMHKWLALLVSLAAAGVGVAVLADFDYDQTDRLQFVQDQSWIDVIHSRYLVGIDGLSVPLVALTLLIVPLCIIYSWNHFPEPRNPKAFLILLLVLHTGMLGTFVAQDLILFFVFFEIVLLPMYFLIGVWGGEQRQYAAIKFFLFTLFGSALMIVSFLALFFVADGETFVMADLARGVAESDMSRLTGLLIFGGMFMGFGIKVPMFPFHTWLPDAHTEAPTVGSVILAAILLKLGTYGFVRVALPILPEAAVEWAPYIGALAVVGIIYGALACLAQTDMKRLIAFSSVSHMGFTMLGIATLTDFGLNAAVMGMVAHGLITGMLFFLAGSVKERYHTLDIKRLGGILVKAPRMGWVLGFTAMASLGLPGLAGFWGEFPAILSTYQPGAGLSEELFRVYMVVAAVGTVFAAGYLLWLYQRTAFGTPTDEFTDDDIADVTVPEWIAWTPML